MDGLKTNMIAALTKTMGIVTPAAEKVGISRQTHYNWMKDDPDYKEAVESLSDVALDFAESKLVEKMEGVMATSGTKDGELIVYSIPPSDTALIFYLKTKGKKRGYIERQEITGADNAPLIQILQNL